MGDLTPSSSSSCAFPSWRSKLIISGSAPELQQPNCDILPLHRVHSGWLAAAQAPWSKNPPRMRAPPKDKSLCPISGECGKIFRRKPNLGSVLNSGRSVALQVARTAAKRNRGYGCLRRKRNSWTVCFRLRSRICAPLPRCLLKEINSVLEAMRSPAPARTGSPC